MRRPPPEPLEPGPGGPQVGSLAASGGGDVPHVELDVDGIGILEGFLADY